MKRVEKIFSDLVGGNHIDPKYMVGCSAEDIANVERACCKPLPAEYESFLRLAGRGAGRLFQGTAIFYPRLLELHEDAIALLSELGVPEVLPDKAFVFMMHQGYELKYFVPDRDDPEVVQFWEGQEGESFVWPSFSDFIRDRVQRHLSVMSSLNPE